MHHHGAGLRRLLTSKRVQAEKREALLGALQSDHHTGELSRQDRAMLDYAVKLTRSPSEIDEGDVRTLRGAGFDDRAIHDICAVTAYFAFVNRIADGLGVELE